MSWPSNTVYSAMHSEQPVCSASAAAPYNYAALISQPLATLAAPTCGVHNDSNSAGVMYQPPQPCYINSVMSNSTLYAKIFFYLPDYIQHLLVNSRVCKLWYTQSVSAACWQRMELSHCSPYAVTDACMYRLMTRFGRYVNAVNLKFCSRITDVSL